MSPLSRPERSPLTVHDFTRILRTRWKIICGVFVVAILGAVAYLLLTAPQYQASTRLFVSTTSDGTNTQTNDGGLFAQRRVLSYTQLLQGALLAQRTIDKLGLDMSAAELQREITATAPTDTVLIDVMVQDSSPTRARDIANTLSDEFVVMAAALETPDLGARPNAQVVVQQRAGVPEDPVSPKKARTLAIAGVVGLLLGVLAALVRDRLDGTIRRPETVETATGVGVIGEIPIQTGHRNGPPVAFGRDDTTVADAFRELRINLQSLEMSPGPRVVLVASPSAGEGRTTTAVNLALALAEADRSVVLVDADLRRPRVAACFDLPDQTGFGTVLAGATPLTDALQQTRFAGLTVLPAGELPANPTELLGTQAARTIFEELSGRFDYVVVDTPPMTVKDAALTASSAEGVLLVVRYGTSHRRALAIGVAALKRAGAPLVGAVAMVPAGKATAGASRRAAHGK
ncbi:polysaccharide biosynthesis tyrosine autokinase [Mycolicibacterium rufum]|uniref:non-specific protein-tyrosine kinase n=1 Tax=Mycolicibacterium rufum TaxID=318424 RepID=A0A9X3BRF4_9MYCO|nr:polysaccharide biosynthesis tyrosine autokinase [Mycolicibacterium rufum]MCV7073497.1 polysaccharide biosynthesis tyrosine autokinase [Mycolicibacterium rufum]ULP38194.2 polysaccharide biosynthesis tyrosine autokinase [Mycolicibacterium rufum]